MSFPGTCIVVNWNHIVFLAMDNSLGFSISSRFLFEYPYKQLVIGNEDEIVAAQHIMLALVQSISNEQALPLNWTVPRFCWVCDSSSC